MKNYWLLLILILNLAISAVRLKAEEETTQTVITSALNNNLESLNNLFTAIPIENKTNRYKYKISVLTQKNLCPCWSSPSYKKCTVEDEGSGAAVKKNATYVINDNPLLSGAQFTEQIKSHFNILAEGISSSDSEERELQNSPSKSKGLINFNDNVVGSASTVVYNPALCKNQFCNFKPEIAGCSSTSTNKLSPDCKTKLEEASQINLAKCESQMNHFIHNFDIWIPSFRNLNMKSKVVDKMREITKAQNIKSYKIFFQTYQVEPDEKNTVVCKSVDNGSIFEAGNWIEQKAINLKGSEQTRLKKMSDAVVDANCTKFLDNFNSGSAMWLSFSLPFNLKNTGVNPGQENNSKLEQATLSVIDFKFNKNDKEIESKFQIYGLPQSWKVAVLKKVKKNTPTSSFKVTAKWFFDILANELRVIYKLRKVNTESFYQFLEKYSSLAYLEQGIRVYKPQDHVYDTENSELKSPHHHILIVQLNTSLDAVLSMQKSSPETTIDKIADYLLQLNQTAYGIINGNLPQANSNTNINYNPPNFKNNLNQWLANRNSTYTPKPEQTNIQRLLKFELASRMSSYANNSLLVTANLMNTAQDFISSSAYTPPNFINVCFEKKQITFSSGLKEKISCTHLYEREHQALRLVSTFVNAKKYQEAEVRPADNLILKNALKNQPTQNGIISIIIRPEIL